MANGFFRHCGMFAIPLSLVAQTRFDGAIDDLSLRTTLSQPVMGVIFDAVEKGLRPVFGVPGAAVAGAPLRLAAGIRLAASSPRQDYILAAGEAPDLLLFRTRNGSATALPLPPNLAAPDRIALSPSGAAAALYYADTGTVRILSGLPDKVSDMRAFDLPGAPSLLTVSDDGRAAIAAASFAGEEQTIFWKDGAGVVRLFGIASASAATFFPQSQEAVLADAAVNQLVRIRMRDGAPELVPIAGPDDGVAGPVGLAISGTGLVFVANRDSRSVLALDSAGGPPRLLGCYCTPSALTPMSASLFRLTEPDGQRLWLLDTERATARIVFVPLAAPDTDPR